MKVFIFFMFIFIFEIQASTENLLFVPGKFSPLSPFLEKKNSLSEELSFSVKSEIIQYVLSNNYQGWIAHQASDGALNYLPITNVDQANGKVSIVTNSTGRFVAVAETFINDYPIVTHWKQSLNSGKGGFQEGAADAIGTLDYYPGFGIGESTDLFNTGSTTSYTYNTNKYALFSSDPVAPTSKVPSFERYVGENYSVSKITDRLATYLSLKSLEKTGMPILHKNYPAAFGTNSNSNSYLSVNIPAFQVLHSLIVSGEADKPALATFILPPRWTNSATQKYPILFNGFYDINQSFSFGNGLDFIEVINNLQVDNIGSAIGVLWNGGGAVGSQTASFATYLNVAIVYHLAEAIFKADSQKSITVGISRGGSTALSVASNPFFSNYKVQYALAYSPPTLYGDITKKWVSPNYPGLYANYSWGTGYHRPFAEGFTDPETGLAGPELFLNNIVGNTSVDFANLLSPASDWLLNSLKQKNVSVMLSSGTHDAFIPFNHQLTLYNKLTAQGIPTEFNIGYRFGHTIFTNKNQQTYWAMKEVMTGSLRPFSGIKHYKRLSETAEGFKAPVQFTPTHHLSFQLPKLAWRGQNITYEVTGTNGVSFAITYFKIDDSKWNSSRVIEFVGEQKMIVVDKFQEATPLQNRSYTYQFPTTLTPGLYIYFAAKSLNNGTTWDIMDLAKVPQLEENKYSIFEILDAETSSTGLELNKKLNLNDRGWGLSTD